MTPSSFASPGTQRGLDVTASFALGCRMPGVAQISEPSLIVLVGVSGSGKTTFANRHFRPGQIVSSDACRRMICDDENDQSVTAGAFELVHMIVRKRLERRRLTVVDATSVKAGDRRHYVRLARRHGVPAIAVVLNLPEAVILERTAARADRDIGPGVVAAQLEDLRSSLAGIGQEGFDRVVVLESAGAVDGVSFEITPAAE